MVVGTGDLVTDAGVTTEGVEDTVGGECVLPAVLFGSAVGTGVLAGGYKTYRGIQGYFENKRYWEEYQKNTGVKPRYGYRSGYNYDWSATLSGLHQASNTGTYGYYGYTQEWWK